MKPFDLIVIASASAVAVSGCGVEGIAARRRPTGTPAPSVELCWQRRADEVACHSVAFSPDGGLLAVGGDGTHGNASVTLWSEAGELVQTLAGHRGHVTTLSFSPNGEYLASAGGLLGRGTEIRIWQTQGWCLIASLAGHTGDISAIAFSPSGDRLVSASFDLSPGTSVADNSLRVWALYPVPHAIAVIGEFQYGVEDAVWLTRQTVACALYGGGVATIGVTDHKLRGFLRGRFVTALGRWGQQRSIAGLRNGTLILVDVITGEALWRCRCAHAFIEDVAVAPKAGFAVAVSADGSMGLVDLRSGECVFKRQVSADALYCVGVAETSDRLLIATAGSDGIVRVWKLRSGAPR